MTTTLVLTFPLGRYHATPWGRHVNEGQVEFPPSSWRLLRALYATWQDRIPDLDETTVRSLLGRLATPPTYHVPEHALGHTRHYYPDSTSRRGKASTDRTIDAFVSLDPAAELGIRWDLDLPPEESAALGLLADALPYLGRAESVCEARLDAAWAPSGRHQAWAPTDIGIPQAPEDAEEWSGTRLLAPRLPLDLGALMMRPIEIRARKLVLPPSFYLLDYRTAPVPSAPPPVTRGGLRPTVVRLAVLGRARPVFTDTLEVTEAAHGAATRMLNELRNHAKRSSNLIGRDADGVPLAGHRHAHYLALPDAHRRVAELVVWAPDGLDDDELHALTLIRNLTGELGTTQKQVPVRVSGFGTDELLPARIAARPSRRWRSLTPYVPSGHPKGDPQEFIIRRLPRDLEYLGQSRPRVGVLDLGEVPTEAQGVFERRRRKDRLNHRFVPPAAWLELTFDEPVTGPLCVGALSHFGLGLFSPVDEDDG